MLYSTRTSRIYGLDILIDTGSGGRPGHSGPTGADLRLVDPANVVIRAAGVSTVDGDEFYDGDERRLLRILDQRFAVLPTGVISTWHGSRLDLPFLRARARILDVDLGLRLTADNRSGRLGTTRRRPTDPTSRIPGQSPPVCGAWHAQRHLDLCRVYRHHDIGSGTDELVGLDPRRGAHLARSLAERRWFRARRYVDRVPQARPLTSYTWTCMSPDYADGPAVNVLGG